MHTPIIKQAPRRRMNHNSKSYLDYLRESEYSQRAKEFYSKRFIREVNNDNSTRGL